MGHITIFSIDDCPHCQRAKAALRDRNIPYTEISLSKYPQRRNGMLQLADSLTVPQVFFNSRHVGGADDTVKLLEEWDEDPNFSSAKTKFDVEVADVDDPVDDERLQVPTEPPIERVQAPPRDPPSVQLPDGQMVSVFRVTEMLKTILQPRTLTFRLTSYKNAFRVSDAIEALQKTYNCSKEEAVALGRRLQVAQIIHHVADDDHTFDTTNKDKFFRLQCHHTPAVINSYRVWTERVHPDPMALIKDLKTQFSKVEREVTNHGLVDYIAMAELDSFAEFEEAVCELQGIDWAAMDDSTKRAFGINVYNLMVKYAFAKVGISTKTATRGAFFSQTSMNIGGYVMGLNDLEHGVLRANRRPPYTLSVPFGPNDPRSKLPVAMADCRMHFALSCGAKSCPPVKNFTADSIEEELRIVALAFCEQDENVRVDVDTRTLYLNTILYWYRVDFASSTDGLPKAVVPFLRGGKKESLQGMIDDGKKITVKFLDYDWTPNGSAFMEFNPSILMPNRSILSR